MPDLQDGESTQMQGSGSKPYVLKNTGGVYSCTCPAWRNQSVGIERRTCKHLRKLRGDAAEEARIGGALPAKPVKAKADGEEVAGPPLLLAERWSNDADLVGGVNLDGKDRFLKQTLLDLSQTATSDHSLKLGGAVLAELGQVNTLHKARVEQAGFAVLKAPDVPSILVETAFISNPEEEKRLKDAAYQEKISSAILGGGGSPGSRTPASQSVGSVNRPRHRPRLFSRAANSDGSGIFAENAHPLTTMRSLRDVSPTYPVTAYWLRSAGWWQVTGRSPMDLRRNSVASLPTGYNFSPSIAI